VTAALGDGERGVRERGGDLACLVERHDDVAPAPQDEHRHRKLRCDVTRVASHRHAAQQRSGAARIGRAHHFRDALHDLRMLFLRYVGEQSRNVFISERNADVALEPVCQGFAATRLF